MRAVGVTVHRSRSLVVAIVMLWGWGCRDRDHTLPPTDGGVIVPGEDGGTTPVADGAPPPPLPDGAPPPGGDGGTITTDGGTTGADGGLAGADGGVMRADGGRVVDAGTMTCTPSCGSAVCGPDGCGGSCGSCAPGETCDATSGVCRISAVTFAGGTIAALRAIRPSLVFSDLTVTGTLVIPASERTVTITGDTLVFTADVDTSFGTCDPIFRDGPDLTLRATTEVRVRGVDLHGQIGDEETGTTTCRNCTGGDGGTLTIEAPDIYVGGAIATWGAPGSRQRIDASYAIGCDGGNGGDVVLRSTATIVCEDWDLDLYGSNGGSGLGGGASGARGADGTFVLEGADVALEEIDGLNALYSNAQIAPYRTLRFLGGVNVADDSSLRSHPSALYVTLSPTAEDYLEDIYRIVFPPRMSTFTATLEFATHDLDLYLLDSTLTRVLAMANGTSRPETFTATRLTSGTTYYLAVSFADDNPTSPATPVAYTLRID